MEIGKDITQILLPGLDEENCISVDDAKQLLEQADFNLEAIGVTENEGESLADMLAEMDSFFEILHNEDQDIIKCKAAPQQQEAEKPAAPQPQGEQSPEEIATLYRRICGITKLLLRKNDYPNGWVPLTDLGQEMKAQGHVLPAGEKISSFLRKQPELFELMNDEINSYVRPIKDGKLVASAIAPAPAAKSRTISLYDIFDFAYFSKYSETKQKLAELAVEDDWFVISDDAINDRYALLDYKLRTRYAMLVKAQLQGEGEGIQVALNEASFDTGFVTAEGHPIMAMFSINVQRGNGRWQTYEFKEFRVAE